MTTQITAAKDTTLDMTRTLNLMLHCRAVKTVALPTTLEDFYQMGSRQEGHVCELRAPPNYRSVHGYIVVPSTQERLFFQESLSGIAKSETGNIRMQTIVQFSVDKNERGFFAKNLFIKVRTVLSFIIHVGTNKVFDLFYRVSR